MIWSLHKFLKSGGGERLPPLPPPPCGVLLVKVGIWQKLGPIIIEIDLMRSVCGGPKPDGHFLQPPNDNTTKLFAISYKLRTVEAIGQTKKWSEFNFNALRYDALFSALFFTCMKTVLIWS